MWILSGCSPCTNEGVGFVTRLPRHIRYRVLQEHPGLPDSPVLGRSDSSGSALITAGVTIPKPCAWCITGTRKPARTMCFLTNLPDLPALAVADLYRQRWQIETFFRWIKQNLKIKTFYGTSENGVLIQIWTAMIAYLLLLWIKLRSRAGWSILELTRLVQNLIMERCNLWALLCPRTSDPPDYGQLTLFNLGGAC